MRTNQIRGMKVFGRCFLNCPLLKFIDSDKELLE